MSTENTKVKPLSLCAANELAQGDSFARSWSEPAAWTAFLLYLVLVVPLFLRMPLCCDVDFFNVMARTLLRGELLYKDMCVLSFSGLSLIHAGVRGILGWSSEALRGADLLIVGGVAWLLAGKLPSALPRGGRVWLAFVLFVFYLGTSEWCHAQPDTWMLLPTAAALCLRCRQVVEVASEEAPAALRRRAVLEGVCWGLAFTIKPFVALPALACFGVTAIVALRLGRAARKRLAVDLGGVLLGGLLVGIASVAWLYLSGNWPYFRENLRSGPGLGEYYARSRDWSARFERLVPRLWPWSLVHLVALPLALAALASIVARLIVVLPAAAAWSWNPRIVVRVAARPADALRKEPLLLGRAMIAACYLGWFVEANFIQHQFDYHLVSPLMLALVLVASYDGLFRWGWVRWGVLPALLFVALAYHPLLQPTRLSAWMRCWKEGGSTQLREQLGSLDKEDHTFLSSWPELAAVEQFLKEQGAGDGEVTCWCNSSLAVYSDLHIQPSNRYVMLGSWQAFMPGRVPSIVAELEAGPQRFVITDLHENFSLPLQLVPQVQGLHDLAESDVLALRLTGLRLRMLAFPYPWNLPVVFRAGRYLVHRVDPLTPAPQPRAVLPAPPPSFTCSDARSCTCSRRSAPAGSSLVCRVDHLVEHSKMWSPGRVSPDVAVEGLFRRRMLWQSRSEHD